MAKKNNSKVTSEQAAQPPLVVNAQYIKDLSFENPSMPLSAGGGDEPDISIHIEAQARALQGERSFEVSLRIHVDAKRKDKQMFLLELEYAGIFSVGSEVPEEYVRPILMVECPRILFPFARQAVASTVQEGGYPALLLAPVDFADLYQRQVAQEQQAQQEKDQHQGSLQ